MDTDRLARRYDVLGARERYALLVAARVRGDEVETERLLESAPTEQWRVPHHRDFADAISELALLHLARLLDAAALLWRAESLRSGNECFERKATARRARDRRLLATMRRLASRLVALREGWRQFCAELAIDPEALLRDLPGYASVCLAADVAPALAAADGDVTEPNELLDRTEPTAIAVFVDYREALKHRTGEVPSV